MIVDPSDTETVNEVSVANEATVKLALKVVYEPLSILYWTLKNAGELAEPEFCIVNVETFAPASVQSPNAWPTDVSITLQLTVELSDVEVCEAPVFDVVGEALTLQIIVCLCWTALVNVELSDPHVDFELLLSNSKGVAVFSGTVFGLFGKLFDKGKFTEIDDLYSKIKKTFGDKFYIEIQRHNDQNEIGFEKFNLKKSLDLEIPIIATNEVFYLDKEMHEAHDALICIGNKTYVNEKNRLRFTDQHYLKTSSEMYELFADLPEALENNYNFPLRCSYRPLFSNPILPNISSDKDGNADEILKKDSIDGLLSLIHIWRCRRAI